MSPNVNTILTTIEFYYKKVVAVVDAFINNAVKTLEVSLSKVPAAISDIYDIVKNNLVLSNLVSLVLTYLVFINFVKLIAMPVIFIALLVAILLLLEKVKVK